MATAKKKARKTYANKSEKFVGVGTLRVSRALKAIKAIGQLGGSPYESTKEQREKIVTALETAVKTAKAQLEGAKTSEFSF